MKVLVNKHPLLRNNKSTFIIKTVPKSERLEKRRFIEVNQDMRATSIVTATASLANDEVKSIKIFLDNQCKKALEHTITRVPFNDQLLTNTSYFLVQFLSFNRSVMSLTWKK